MAETKQFIKIEDLGPLAEKHFNFMLKRDESEPLRVFAQYSKAIYRQLKKDRQEGQKAAITLARAERLTMLMAMFTESNIIDFLLIKWPCWWLNDKIERYKERKQHHV